MKSVGKIPPQDWLNAESSMLVMEVLMSQGGTARFVGGCVRDTIAGRPISDIDIATTEFPHTVMSLLSKAGSKIVPMGESHGSVLAVVAGTPFHITTLRSDIETYGRHDKVSFVDNWEEDAKRRDFTLNAMYVDPDGTLYDPWGGRDDIKAGRVRFIGKAQERIKEDYLRILRFFRFQAYFGSQPPDQEALLACKAASPCLDSLSGERVWYELRRLLVADNPLAVVELMWHSNIWTNLFPQLELSNQTMQDLNDLIHLEINLKSTPNPLRRLARLVEGNVAVAREMSKRLRYSRASRQRLLELTRIIRDPPNIDERKIRSKLLYEAGVDLFQDIVLLLGAQQVYVDSSQAPQWSQNHLDYAHHWPHPSLPVRGRDIIALGIKPGPQVSQILDDFRQWWYENGCEPTYEKSLAWLKKRNKL